MQDRSIDFLHCSPSTNVRAGLRTEVVRDGVRAEGEQIGSIKSKRGREQWSLSLKFAEPWHRLSTTVSMVFAEVKGMFSFSCMKL